MEVVRKTDETTIIPINGNSEYSFTLGAKQIYQGSCNMERPGMDEVFRVKFQKGPIKEVGVNGCQTEDLLAIVEHRLKSFQDGEFPCLENDIALNHIQSAIIMLERRTLDREKRGVEGAYKK